MKHTKHTFVSSFTLLLLLLQASYAETIYIGDSAAEGQALSIGHNNQPFSLEDLTVVMHGSFQGTSSSYTAQSDVTLKLTEVNFIDGGAGTLTPFAAIYKGSNTTAGSTSIGTNHTVIAMGDAIQTYGGNQLRNTTFASAAPTISLSAGDVLVAGFHERGKVIIIDDDVRSGALDYVDRTNTINGVGNGLSSDADFTNFDTRAVFNLGFTEVSDSKGATVDIPEPRNAALVLGLGALTYICSRRRIPHTVS